MTQPKKMSKPEKLCWLAALILMLAAFAMAARANTGEVPPCVEAAIAAKQARDLHPSMGKNSWEVRFIQVSKILWHYARGDEARFLRWYREACDKHMAPDYYRVKDGRIYSEREV